MIKVKPLEWEEGPVGHHTDYAQSLCGEWAAWEIKGHAYYRSPGMKSGKLGGITLEEAKAAAQADYERRIISALEPEYTTHLEPGEFGDGATVRRAPEHG